MLSIWINRTYKAVASRGAGMILHTRTMETGAPSLCKFMIKVAAQRVSICQADVKKDLREFLHAIYSAINHIIKGAFARLADK
jgi:hypothetical protein